MPPRVPIPAHLVRRPFSIAQALDVGIGEERLRGRDLARPFHGVRAIGRADTLHGRLLEHAPVRGDGFYSHLTAARIWNVPLPRPFTPTEPLHVSMPWPRRAPRGVGVIGHALRDARVVHRHGFPVTTPEQTWLALAPLLPWRELVVAADHLVLDPFVLDPHDIRPFTTIDRLRAALAEYHGRGAAAAARAIGYVRQGAESRPETLYRLLLVEAGLPEPELQVSLVGTRWDMYFREWRTIAAYDGDQHRTSTAQWEKDAEAQRRLRRAGIALVTARRTTLLGDPARAVRHVEEALRDNGWRR